AHWHGSVVDGEGFAIRSCALGRADHFHFTHAHFRVGSSRKYQAAVLAVGRNRQRRGSHSRRQTLDFNIDGSVEAELALNSDVPRSVVDGAQLNLVLIEAKAKFRPAHVSFEEIRKIVASSAMKIRHIDEIIAIAGAGPFDARIRAPRVVIAGDLVSLRIPE